MPPIEIPITWTGAMSSVSMSCAVSDANNGTVVGWSGTILRTTNGGITFIEVEKSINIRDDFILSQNYPNPFNPETTIKFTLQKNCHVTLRVHDILGRQVSTIVDKQLSAGYHEIQFNAKGLASGIYFYQIQI